MRSQLSLFVMVIAMVFSMTGTSNVFAAGSTPDPIPADPIWCPVGVTPRSGLGGCSPSFRTLTRLLTWLRKNDPDRPGVIWLEKTYNSAAEGVSGFTLDGARYANLDNHSLTIQGGWNGLRTTSVDHGDPSAFSGDFLHIVNWQNAITVNDIFINGAVENGLAVYTTGDINLSNITSNNNHAGPSWAFGLDLNNTDDGSSSNVSLTGTNIFNGNDIGLRIVSNGDITLNNVTANENRVEMPSSTHRGYGAAILGAGSVNLSGTNMFNNNEGWGLHVISDGAITLENLSANGNESEGAELNNQTGKGGVNLNGSNVFSGNGQNGLRVLSNGRIRLIHITTDGNGHDSAWLNRDGIDLDTSGDAIIECAKVYRNGGYGVDAVRVTGSLILDDVTFTDNVSGPYSYGGVPDIHSGGCTSLPLLTMKIIHDSRIELNCTQFSGTEVILPDGRKVILHCPTDGEVYIRFEKLDPIPAPLPEEVSFISFVDLSFKDDKTEMEITPGPVLISFATPKDVKVTHLAILYWNGDKWVELEGKVSEDGTYFEAETDFVDTFVFVKK